MLIDYTKNLTYL